MLAIYYRFSGGLRKREKGYKTGERTSKELCGAFVILVEHISEKHKVGKGGETTEDLKEPVGIVAHFSCAFTVCVGFGRRVGHLQIMDNNMKRKIE